MIYVPTVFFLCRGHILPRMSNPHSKTAYCPNNGAPTVHTTTLQLRCATSSDFNHDFLPCGVKLAASTDRQADHIPLRNHANHYTARGTRRGHCSSSLDRTPEHAHRHKKGDGSIHALRTTGCYISIILSATQVDTKHRFMLDGSS